MKRLKENLILEVKEAFDDLAVELGFIVSLCDNGENTLEDIKNELEKLIKAVTE